LVDDAVAQRVTVVQATDNKGLDHTVQGSLEHHHAVAEKLN